MVISYGERQYLLSPKAPRRLRASLEQWKKEPTDQPRENKKKERLHIYQRRDREDNAMENFYWFYEEWEIINNRFMEKFGKRLHEILMELQHMYRVKKENILMLENVKKKEDINYIDSWKLCLRENWEIVPDLWRGLKFPTKKIPEPPKLVERIGRPDRPTPIHKYFSNANAHLKVPKKEWGKFENFCYNVVERLRNAELHYPEFPFLKVFGTQLQRRLPKVVEPFVCKNEHQKYQRSPIPATCLSPSLFFEGPGADLSPSRLQFACKPGEVVSHTVKLENLGSTALFYTWERRPIESLGVTTPKQTLGKHITACRCFSVMNGTGSLLSGEARQFVFRFKSDVQGVFMESWVLRIAPRLRRTLDPVYLKGVAVLQGGRFGNFFNYQGWECALQEKMTRALNHRELMRGIGESLEIIQERAAKRSQPTKEFRNGDYMFSSEAFVFIKENLAFNPPIYFIPSVYNKFEILATVVKELLEQQPPLDTSEAREGLEDSMHSGSLEDGVITNRADNILAVKAPGVKSPTENNYIKVRSPKTKTVVSSIPPPEEMVLYDSEGDTSSDGRLGELLGPGSIITTRQRTETSEAPSMSSLSDLMPEVAQQVERLWDGSVATISDSISNIQDEERRKELQIDFDQLMVLAQVPPHQTALFHVCMYHTLYDLTDAVGEIFENVTEESSRPTAVRLIQNFYTNYLKEKAEKEELDQLEAESSCTSSTVKEKPDLASLLAALENKVDVSTPAEAQEMLTYCLKWIQIMTELRCAMPHAFNTYDEDVLQEQQGVMDFMDGKIADYPAEDESFCWKIFSLERQKQELVKEARGLPRIRS